ncbi:HNH endonuclease [Methylobacter sp.]|jgi:putative restriction endonuclease|uniref:HNH endonuclease n=1 Tax=Methylobacter sp. TaxID=2051955 RepID=UPI003DA446A1
MYSAENKFYKSIGFELMAELASFKGQSEVMIAGNAREIYQALPLDNGMEVKFTRWRDGVMPFYIILFDRTGHYAFELDLSMIVYSGGFYTWHLKAPSNVKNRQFLSEWLGNSSTLNGEYCEKVKMVKQILDSGTNVPKNGYRFIENADWPDLCSRFIELMTRAISTHSKKEQHSSNFKEAENDADPSYGKQKLRRNQARFRLNLIDLYGGKCVITGETVIETIEAAHIVKHSESGLNHTDNGILLRSDVHRLFDANLVGIEPNSMKVRIAPALFGTNYEKLNGKKIRSRKDGNYPSRNNLQRKWEEAGLGE